MRGIFHFGPIIQLDFLQPLILVYDLWLLEQTKGSNIVSIHWVQLFKQGQFHSFSLCYNLTSYGLWPWYVNFDLINKCRFPCCIYDLTLVENPSKHVKVEAKCWSVFHNRQYGVISISNINNIGIYLKY